MAGARMMQEGVLPFHIVSDHVFLGATILVSLHVELVCVLSDAVRLWRRRHYGRQALLQVAMLAGLMLYLATAVDMYFTAKYYHTPAETVSTVVVVFLLFQLPVLAWVDLKHRAALAA